MSGTASGSGRRILGGLLVGGRSVRMGRSKALVEYGTSSFAEIVADALDPHVHALVVIGDGDVPERLVDRPRIRDAPGTVGPLAGVLAALRADRHATWVIAACDLPLLSERAVGWLVSQRRDGAWAVLPSLERGTVEPLLALYEPESLALVEPLAFSDRPAPSSLASSSHVVCPTPPAALKSAWRNVNTPGELDALP